MARARAALYAVRRPCCVQALQQAFASFAAQFSEWRQRAYSQCKAVFDRAVAESGSVDFDDEKSFLRCRHSRWVAAQRCLF